MEVSRIADWGNRGGELANRFVSVWIFLVFVFAFQLFDNFPFAGAAYEAEIPVLLFLALFALVHYGRKLYRRQPLSRIELLLVCLLFLPFISALSAWISFGQPMWIGILADRRWIRIIAGLFVFRMLLSRRISWKSIQRIFLLLAFVSLSLYLFIWLFLNPNSLSGGFYFLDIPTKGVQLKIVPVFVIWAAIYFLLRWIRGQKASLRLLNPVVFSVFLGYVVFIYKSRATIIVLAAVLFLAAVLESRRGRRVRTIVILLLLLMCMGGIVRVVKPQEFRRQLSGFRNIVAFFSGGDGIMDASLANRLSQGTVAWWSISRSFRPMLFGNGRVSRHWSGKAVASFGYFYPADIGWLGIVFRYGFLGFVLINLSFLFVWKEARNKQCQEDDDVFLASLNWWLVYLFLRSVLNGIVASDPALVMVPVFLIYWRCSKYNIPLVSTAGSVR
ncbi:MAG: hypothetical protein GXO69_06510 [Acidobacteria bacterium]|nr:hypothetical protein [Acidobacteriota bacterium]